MTVKAAADGAGGAENRPAFGHPPMQVILHCPPREKSLLPAYVSSWLAVGVTFVACVGDGADEIEDEIDWIVQEDARHITTTAHVDESIDEVRAFVSAIDPPGILVEVRS